MKRNMLIILSSILLIICIVGIAQFSQKTEAPQTDTRGWQTLTDNVQGVRFTYPAVFATTTYIHSVDWPPKIELIKTPYTCTEAGIKTGRAGITEKRTIAEKEYCITRVSEGAAGSTYTQYAYAWKQSDSTTAILTFTLRMVQCLNYDKPESDKCLAERNTFSIDSTIGTIAQSLTFTASKGNEKELK